LQVLCAIYKKKEPPSGGLRFLCENSIEGGNLVPELGDKGNGNSGTEEGYYKER
jgi:hypothetical protein